MSLRVSLGAVLALLTQSACGGDTTNRAACPAGQVCFELGNASDPNSLDPHQMTSIAEHRIIQDVMVGLTHAGPGGEVLPGMATSWETSPDGKVWTFHLRKAVWSDGVPVTAEDFAFALRRILDPETAAEYASLLYFIKNAQPVNTGAMPPSALGVRALGPRTLEISLEHPAPYILELAKHMTMMPVPKHVVEKWGNKWSDPAHYVSNGPYKIRSWTLQKSVVADKNPLYWDADKVCFDRVTYYPTEDYISAERQVRRGELDVQTKLNTNRVAYVRRPDQIPQYVRSHTYLGIYYFAFNTTLPKLKDVRVRRALSMAIDREFLAYQVSKGGDIEPAYTFVPQGTANYTVAPKPEWASWPIEKRQAEARRLLAEAGYGPHNPLNITLTQANTEENNIVLSAQADWNAIGVKTTLRKAEFQVALQSYRMKDFDVSYSGWIADYNDPMAFLYLMDSKTGEMNYGGYNNPRYDALLLAADNEQDLAKRAAILREAEIQMLNDVPVMPFFFDSSTNLVNPKITGWVDNITDLHPSQYMCFKDAKRGSGAARPSGG